MGLGLASAIHTASTGMRASEKTINVSGDNLANSNTIGYKAERANFTSFLPYLYSYGYGPADDAGNSRTAGTNPRTIGMGVELASVTTDFSQGTFQEGMSNLDIAINGNGFFNVMQPNDPFATPYFTRNGVLNLNSDAYLTTNNGLYVMGYDIDYQFRIQPGILQPLRIPIGELTIAQQTQNVQIEGILNAVGDSATQGTVLRTKPMTDLSKSSPGDTKLTASQMILPRVEGQTTATGTAAGGAIEAGDYLYRLTFVDANGVESDYSAPISANVASGQNSITLSNLPTLDNGYTQLRIYRAADPQDPTKTPDFYQVADLDLTVNPPNSFLDLQSTASIVDPEKKLDLSRLEGTYQYYVTYVDANGNESRPSLISDPISVNGGTLGGQLELSNIPTVGADNPDGWESRKIYRSTGTDATQFYLVGEISNMDANATLIDRLADADLLNQPEMNFAGGGNTLANESTRLIDVGQQNASGHFERLFPLGTLVFDPTKGETSLRQATLEITETTTVGDYLKFLNEAYGLRTTADGVPKDQGPVGSAINNGSPGASVNGGAFYITGNAGEPNVLELRSGDMYMRENHQLVNLGWTETQSAVGEGKPADLTVYDSLGAAVNVRLTMVLESKSDTETVYRWFADSPDNQPSEGVSIATGTGTLTFGQRGELLSASSTTVSVERTAVASESPAAFTFDFDVGGLMALATGAPNVSQVSQDGAGAGVLQDFEILPNGIIMGTFSSGVSRPLGQIPLATFRNQEGLLKVGDSLYRQSANSGDPMLNIAGSGTNGVGAIKSHALELSNTDIGTEIINMILASAMYRGTAKVITTSNEMFDALLRIV